MNTGRERQLAIRVLGLSVMLFLGAASGIATPPARASACPGVLPDAPPDSLLILLPPRSPEAIQQEQTAAEAMGSAADADLISAQSRQGEAKARVEVCKSELEAIKAKIKLAKEQKNQTEQADLELKAKAKDLQLDALKRRQDMRDAEAGFAGARRKAAQAQSAFLKKELELLGKRNDLLQMSSTREGAANAEGLIRLHGELRELEHRSLELLADAAQAERDMAKGEADLLDRRLQLQQAQIAFLKGPKK